MQDEIIKYVSKLNELFSKKYKSPNEGFDSLPNDGLCITFDKKENRIVHVGYNKNDGRFPKRMEEFFKTEALDATLKRHIGAAMIKGNEDEKFLNLWWKRFRNITKETDTTQKSYKILRAKYTAAVYDYIHENLIYAVVPYQNSTSFERKLLKDKILHALAAYNENKTFQNWLGNNSPRSAVSKYKLWAEEYLSQNCRITDTDIKLLEELMKNN